jgi:NADH:ubiquinone oxidoreductase subunit C
MYTLSFKNVNASLTLNTFEFLKKLLPFGLSLSLDNFTFVVETKPENVLFTLNLLKLNTSLQFSILSSMVAIDYLFRKKRFEVIYELLSVHFNFRIRIKTIFHELLPLVSCFSVFSCATWWEREIWDLFGIYFLQNHEIKRILTDYGFEGHPLRKDFPLSGYVESRYDDLLKRVVCEPLEHAQEFRTFVFTSSWSTSRVK